MTPENVVPPAAYLDGFTPNICLTVAEGNTHKCAFPLTEFLNVWLNFAIYFIFSPGVMVGKDHKKKSLTF